MINIFNAENVNELTKMAMDLYRGNIATGKDPSKFHLIGDKYSVEDANDMFSKKLIKLVSEYAGMPYNDGKLDWVTYSHPMFQHGFFNLIGIVIDAVLPKVLTEQFDRFTSVRNTAWGDKLVVEVTSPDYFRVSKVANGVMDVRRQRLDRRSIELRPEMRSVAVAESLFRILSGKTDWGQFINKVAISMATAIKTDVYDAIYASYTDLDATYQAAGAFVPQTLVEMAEHVRAACGGLEPVIFGTIIALSKVLPATGVAGMTSMNMLDSYNTQGYLGRFRGYNMFALEQAHKPSTDTFAISDNFLLIVPLGANKIANLGFEGEGIIYTNAAEQSAGMEIEYKFQKAWDVKVMAAMKYGIYRVS